MRRIGAFLSISIGYVVLGSISPTITQTFNLLILLLYSICVYFQCASGTLRKQVGTTVLFTAHRSNILAAIVPEIAVFMVNVFFVTLLNLTFCQGSYLAVAYNSEHILRREALESIAERLRKGFSGSPPYEHLMKNLITCPSGGMPLESSFR